MRSSFESPCLQKRQRLAPGDGWACYSTSKPPLLPLSPAYVRAPKRGWFQNRTAASLQLRHAGVFAQREFALRPRRRWGAGCPALAWGRPAAVRAQRPGLSPGPSPRPSPRLSPRPSPRPSPGPRRPQRPALGAAPREGRRAPPCGKPLTKQPALRGGGPRGCETRSGPFARAKTQEGGRALACLGRRRPEARHD